MYVACLTPGADPMVVRRAMCGVPRVDALILAGGQASDGGRWLVDTLGELRRELFLDPELLVLGSVPAENLDPVLRQVSRMLIESHCESTPLGVVRSNSATQDPARLNGACQLRGELESTCRVPTDATIDSLNVYWGAAPLVEAIQSEAKITLVGDTSPGALSVAALFEALRLGPHDWNRLATVTRLAQVIEHPGGHAPLWLHIDDQGVPYCIGPDTFTAEAFEQLLALAAQAVTDETSLPDITVDASQARVKTLQPGWHQLLGVVGAPPSGTVAVEFSYRLPHNNERKHQRGSVHRAVVEWDTVVKPAQQWLS